MQMSANYAGCAVSKQGSAPRGHVETFLRTSLAVHGSTTDHNSLAGRESDPTRLQSDVLDF